MPKVTYPFTPKSTRAILPGQFWAIPLSDGRFACGRVIALKIRSDGSLDSRGFLAGLLDWVGDSPPTSDGIAGRPTIDQGGVHIKTIEHTGGALLGHRPLKPDGIEPDLFLSESPGRNCRLQRGFKTLRRATPREQRKLPVFSTWGYAVIQGIAEKHFVHTN
jgi:hypothetical protein